MLCRIFLLSVVVAFANGHGYIKDPISRSGIYLRPEFNTQPPYDWNYSGVECGGQDLQYSSCGRCGAYSPDYNQGGQYDNGVVVATYQAGSVVEMKTAITAGHYGYVEFELCPQQQESNTCFKKLNVVSATEQIRNGNRVCIPYDNGGEREVTARVQLPSGVRCNRCTIRWTYRTSYPCRPGWEICDNPTPAQVFRNCADVRIQ